MQSTPLQVLRPTVCTVGCMAGSKCADVLTQVRGFILASGPSDSKANGPIAVRSTLWNIIGDGSWPMRPGAQKQTECPNGIRIARRLATSTIPNGQTSFTSG